MTTALTAILRQYSKAEVEAALAAAFPASNTVERDPPSDSNAQRNPVLAEGYHVAAVLVRVDPKEPWLPWAIAEDKEGAPGVDGRLCLAYDASSGYQYYRIISGTLTVELEYPDL